MNPPGRFLGIDAGSRTMKCVVFDGDRVLHREITDNGHDAGDLCLRMIAAHPSDAVTATGYGRTLLETRFDWPTISEIKAFALGCGAEFPGAKTLLDIGGQDTKIIRTDATGRVVKFEMNDRCAAGTGKFFEAMAKQLGYALDEFARIPPGGDDGVDISHMCAVFAESEVTGLLARGVKREAIVRALHRSVVRRLAPRVQQMQGPGPLVFCGGCAQNGLLAALLEETLGRAITLPTHPQFMGALGAAIHAHRQWSMDLMKNTEKEVL